MSKRLYLSDFELQQLDEQTLKELPAAQKDALLVKLLWDLQEARERLKASSQTSSRPPSSDAPWQGGLSEAERSDESESANADDHVLVQRKSEFCPIEMSWLPGGWQANSKGT